MDEFDDHNFAKCQYGFISGRGTSMATAMAHDVSTVWLMDPQFIFVASMPKWHLTEFPMMYYF